MPVTWESWNLTSPIVSRIYLASHLLQSAFIAPLKSITVGRMAPIDAELILAVTVLSTIWAIHSQLVMLPDRGELQSSLSHVTLSSDRSGLRGALSAEPSPYEFNAFNGEPLDSDPADPEIEIMVRLTDRGSGILGKRRCIVTVRYPMEETYISEDSAENSPHDDQRRNSEPDHKLPFWVKR